MRYSITFFLQKETSGFTNTDNLKEKILGVLKQIWREKDNDEVKVDMWCHFGHAYMTKIDEGKRKYWFHEWTTIVRSLKTVLIIGSDHMETSIAVIQ